MGKNARTPSGVVAANTSDKVCDVDPTHITMSGSSSGFPDLKRTRRPCRGVMALRASMPTKNSACPVLATATLLVPAPSGDTVTAPAPSTQSRARGASSAVAGLLM
jgi:hypothetical protein